MIDAQVLMDRLHSQMPNLQIVPLNDPEADALLVVGACTTACTTPPKGEWPLMVVVEGETVDHVPCEESLLAEVVCKKLLPL